LFLGHKRFRTIAAIRFRFLEQPLHQVIGWVRFPITLEIQAVIGTARIVPMTKKWVSGSILQMFLTII